MDMMNFAAFMIIIMIPPVIVTLIDIINRRR